MSDQPTRHATAFLDGGGAAGARMRAVDWRATPLGAPERWPRSLKTVVRIALDSRYAMWLAWGPELTFFCNDAYAPTLGVKQDWAIGARADRIWAEIWPDIGPRIEQVLTTGQATWDERLMLILERSGAPEETFHTFSYSPLPDDRGRVHGMLCVVTEDTPRVLGERRAALLGELAEQLGAARSEAALFEALARCAGGGAPDLPFVRCALRAADGRLAPAGPDAASLARWPLEEALAAGAPYVVSDPALLAGMPHGAWRRPPAQALLLPIAGQGDAAPAGVLVAGLNPFRPLDDAYRRWLELAAGQVAAALAGVRAWESNRRRAEELAELDRAKTAFFSNVSHELRTPLTLMLGPTEAALEGDGALAGEELRLVHRNQQRLLRLVNSLLDFARIEAGRMPPALEPVDLAAETAQLASVFRSAVERAGMRYVVETPPLPGPVWIDRDMWEKIVLNLLSNAFKYTLLGEIRVSLGEDGGDAVLAVRDTGVGVPAEELGRLFDRFHRVEGARGRTLEGTGIGLALVRELAALQRGRVEVESAPGEGSVFRVRLPLAPPPGAVARPAARPPSGLGATMLDEALRWLPQEDGTPASAPEAVAADAPLPAAAAPADAERLLVVDDNADMRAYLQRLLGARWRVEVASDGVQALDSLRRERPDLVLTDVMMPRLDGLGLIAALRADPALMALPVVMLSARAGEEARLDGLRAGADDYLAKPFGARELVARIESLLALARSRREALRREEALRARTRMVLEAIHEAYVRIDGEGRIEEVNAAAEAMSGLRREALAGRVYWDVFGDIRGSELEASLRRALAERTPVVLEYRAEEDRWLEVSAWPEPGGLAIYARDVSERRRAMQALEEADRRKDEFLATLAHELRNPLAPIRSAAEILATPRVGDAELARTRDVIRRQTQHMARLLDDLLDVSRITRGRLELKREPVAVGAVVDTAVEATRALLPGRLENLAVAVDDRARVVDADPVRLAQILTNLLTNAAKYTDAGGAVRLAVTGEGDELVLRVRDAGIGMTPEQISRAFELFSQFPQQPHRAEGGLGIGLALVRGIVALHGGTVEARSEGLGCGSEFVVRLPLATVAPAPAPRPMRVAPGSEAALRVLVVDDNVDAALMLCAFLEMSGHRTQVAHAGRDALAAALRFGPDVVLLDIGLPDIDGYDVARGLRADPALAPALLVAVTGWGQAGDVQRALEAGFDFHLVKPADPQALLRLLAAAPRRSESARAQ